MKDLNHKLIYFLFVSILLLSNIIGYAQDNEKSMFFEKTGHFIIGDYYDFYMSFDEPSILFGAPITESFFYSIGNREVQFFEKARFERSDNGLSIQLSPIGEHYFEKGVSENILIPSPSLGCRKVSKDFGYDFEICFDVYSFYIEYGGILHFGKPISDLVEYNGKLVQYFQNGSLEWHPENSSFPIQVGNLGEKYFDRLNLAPDLLSPLSEKETNDASIETIQTYSSLSFSSIYKSQKQSLTIFVTNQHEMRLKDAEIKIMITYPNGKMIEEFLSPTNDLGISRISISMPESSELPNGRVYIDIEIEYQNNEYFLFNSFIIR